MRNFVDVYQGEGFVEASSPAVLRTSSLANCIGIVFYEPEIKTGHMIHTPSPEYFSVSDYLRRLQSKRSNILAYAFGGAFQGIPLIDEGVTHSRDHIEKTFQSIPKALQTIQWAKNGDMTDLEFDTNLGIYSVDYLPAYMSF